MNLSIYRSVLLAYGEGLVKKAAFLLCVMAMCLLFASAATRAQPASDEVLLTATPDGTRLEVSDGTAHFHIPGDGSWSFTWQPGCPRLPVRKMWVLLPPDAVLESVALASTPASLSRLAPDGSVELTQVPGCEAEAATGAPGELWPDCWARVAAAGQLRKHRYALVEVYPYRCDIAAGTVTVAQSVSLKLTFSRDGASKVHANLLAQDWLPGRSPGFANSSQFESEYRLPENPVLAADPPVDYLIITTEAIAFLPELGQFVGLKESRGLSVSVATIESFTTLPGPDLADQIRDYLKANYESWGLKYLLLIGTPDPDDPDYSDTVGTVPMKLCFPQSYWTDKPPNEVQAATDYYFADLTGNWDADGDGKYGEAFSTQWEHTGDLVAGGIDYAPELLVGRIPFCDVTEVAGFLARLIAYETASHNYDWSSPGALDWRNKVFCVTHKLDDDTPAYQFSQYLHGSLTDQCGYNIFVAHDEDYGVTPPADLVGYSTADIENEWQNRYGVVLWACHGKERRAVDVFNYDQCPALPADTPSIVLQVCCLSGYPDWSDNLGSELMRNGAIATVCASRTTWYVSNWKEPRQGGTLDMGYFMAEELLCRRHPLGRVLQNARDTYCYLSQGGAGYHGANLMAYNLYGDPLGCLGVLRVRTAGLPVGWKGENYFAGLEAAGGVEPYTWSLLSGQVPPGLVLGTTGALHGKPACKGIWTFTVEVTDATGARSSMELTFHAKERTRNIFGCTITPAASASSLLPLGLLLLVLAFRRRRRA